LLITVFDKVTVLYEGRQIYFGRVEKAKQYFIDQGWDCMDRQTTADFLTAVTGNISRNPGLRVDPTARFPRAGYENRVPKTPDDFARLWQQSDERQSLLKEIEGHELKYPKGKAALDDQMEASKMRKSKHIPKKSPYTVTIWMQISACIVRTYQRMWGDKSTLVSTFASNLIMSLVIGSVFYDIPNNTNGFFSKVAPRAS
jgi:ATP-binding cassette, subfamily G (WHITE), member 2, PDR